jgi:transposase
MDNLSSHKVAGAREAIEAAGTRVLLLPAYNPDLKPIEQAFAKLKALLRARAARTVDALWSALPSHRMLHPGRVLELLPPCRLSPVRVKVL